MKYLPFLTGSYTTAPGLSSMAKAEGIDRLVFQIDDQYQKYISNKIKCREEGIEKYFVESKLVDGTIVAINKYIVNQLLQEYPNHFQLTTESDKYVLFNVLTNEYLHWQDDWQKIKSDKYISLFDGLCSQVQEDLAICQLGGDEDYLCAIHLCSPNHWAPADKIGKPFYAVHAPVPDMERTILHYQQMLASIVRADHSSTRFAWGIATDTRLNHHPEPPPGQDVRRWQGRQFNEEQKWYVRSERQNLVGFQEVNAFLFTIRTYFCSVSELSNHEKRMLLSAIRSMSSATLQYKGMNEAELLIEKLEEGIIGQ